MQDNTRSGTDFTSAVQGNSTLGHPKTSEGPNTRTASVPIPENNGADKDLAHEVKNGNGAQQSSLIWVIVALSILSSTFLFALDNTVVAVLQPKIVESLDEIEKLPWLSVAFALGAVSVNLLWWMQ